MIYNTQYYEPNYTKCYNLGIDCRNSEEKLLQIYLERLQEGGGI